MSLSAEISWYAFIFFVSVSFLIMEKLKLDVGPVHWLWFSHLKKPKQQGVGCLSSLLSFLEDLLGFGNLFTRIEKGIVSQRRDYRYCSLLQPQEWIGDQTKQREFKISIWCIVCFAVFSLQFGSLGSKAFSDASLQKQINEQKI